MSVIIELSLPADEFELGAILAIEGESSIELETLVPMGERPVPFFRLSADARDAFENQARAHPSVNSITPVQSRDGETLYALDWDASEESFFAGVLETEASVLGATGTATRWAFELRFPSHDHLSAFQEYCAEADIDIDIARLYNPTKPSAGPFYGLTAPQRETLVRAVDGGYYAIPRRLSTESLGDEFGISDQAVTERLRRGITTLVTNTLLLTADHEAG